jgi:transposase
MIYAQPAASREQANVLPLSLDDMIPLDHPIRLIDKLLSACDWSAFEENYKLERRGRPPIHPRYLAGVWIWAFFRRVSSTRSLELQLRYQLEFQWLTHGEVFDHTTLSKFRRANAKALKDLHRQLIRQAQDLGLVKIADLFVDATKVQANASRNNVLTSKKLTRLIEVVDEQLTGYYAMLEESDERQQVAQSVLGDDANGEQLPAHVQELLAQKEKLMEQLAHCEKMDAERKAKGINPEKNPFQSPAADPDSRILPNKDGGYAPNYVPIIAVEGGLGLIVAMAVTNNVNEQDHLIGVVEQTEEDFGVTVETISADAAYSTGHNITMLEVERGKELLSPHRNGDPPANNPAIRDDLTQPVPDDQLDNLPTTRSTFNADAFVYVPEEDAYYCPQGRPLTRSGTETMKQNSGEVVRTTYQAKSCDDCPLVKRCRGKGDFTRGRRVSRDEFEASRAAHRAKMNTEEAKAKYSRRFGIGERPFAQMKNCFNQRRFSGRGLGAAESEFTLATISHNIQRLLGVDRCRGWLRGEQLETE